MARTHEDFAPRPQLEQSSNQAFGWVFTLVFAIVGISPLVLGNAPRWWALIAGMLVCLATIAAPSLLSAPNKLWTRFGLLAHRVVSAVALAIMFYLMFVPIGLMLRALGKDAVRRRRDDAAESYWIERDPPGPDPGSMSNPF